MRRVGIVQGGGERVGGRVTGFLRELAEQTLELLSPTRCASCEAPGALVCDACLRDMVRINPAHACTRCGAPYGSLLCTECQGDEVELDRCLAAVVFDGPPARIVRAYKDGGERRLSTEIACIMHRAAREAELTVPARYGGLLSRVDAVTFVPVTSSAYRRRGFDHMEAIACDFADASCLPLIDALVKHGSLDQRELAREERLARSRGQYEVVAPVGGMRVLLLDDVITTGATMNAAAHALKCAGAARVDCLAFARVW